MVGSEIVIAVKKKIVLVKKTIFLILIFKFFPIAISVCSQSGKVIFAHA
jgi:hypothetical protein